MYHYYCLFYQLHPYPDSKAHVSQTCPCCPHEPYYLGKLRWCLRVDKLFDHPHHIMDIITFSKLFNAYNTTLPILRYEQRYSFKILQSGKMLLTACMYIVISRGVPQHSKAEIKWLSFCKCHFQLIPLDKNLWLVNQISLSYVLRMSNW